MFQFWDPSVIRTTADGVPKATIGVRPPDCSRLIIKQNEKEARRYHANKQLFKDVSIIIISVYYATVVNWTEDSRKMIQAVWSVATPDPELVGPRSKQASDQARTEDCNDANEKSNYSWCDSSPLDLSASVGRDCGSLDYPPMGG